VVHIVAPSEVHVPDGDIAAEEVKAETERFLMAIEKARADVTFLRACAAEEVGEESAKIFDTQLLFLDDTAVLDPVLDGIDRERKRAAYLFHRNVVQLIEQHASSDSDYFRERANVFRDIQWRVLRHMLEVEDDGDPEHRGVIVSRELAPSDAIRLDRSTIAGFATERGSMTSHAAIMARSKGVPAVVGVKNLLRQVKAGDLVVVDGLEGAVVVNPPAPVLAAYERRLGDYQAFEGSLTALREERAVTQDGRTIDLSANIESPADLDRVLECGADGIGLYRTEFFYIDHARMPEEEEQFRAYREVVERMRPRPVIIRTMDIGGDKVASYLGAEREANPFLGWRGIRYSLEHVDSFRAQLRAIYRASAHGNVKLMLPMITGVEELRAARALAAEVLEELDGKGIQRAERVEFGMMVETPSAVLMADVFAREVDFFSVGSNDLIQYTLAVDRSDPKTATLYQPHHPAIVRGLKRVVEAAHAQKIWVGVCGEMAADPVSAILLIGLGVDELSVSPFLVPEVKTIVRSLNYADAQAVVEQAMSLDSAAAVHALVLSRMGSLLPVFLLPGGGDGHVDA
jgi:phosphotransferase system enzyme I (PtsI)